MLESGAGLSDRNQRENYVIDISLRIFVLSQLALACLYQLCHLFYQSEIIITTHYAECHETTAYPMAHPFFFKKADLSQISALVNELLQEINCIVFSLKEKYCLYDYFAFPE